jgi:indolepyruvate ferredoxin oxidoreductase beta subunit
MKYDIIIAGVGGQGVLSVSAIIGSAARSQGLFVKLSEVHGMSQRGGGVVANLRVSDKPIASDLIPQGCALMILSMEPLESLRYLNYLSLEGVVITSMNPVVNIPDYPNLDELIAKLRNLPHQLLVDSEQLARQAGSARATNMVIIGAASNFLPVAVERLEDSIKNLFAGKGDKIVDINLRAFYAGRGAVQ